MDMNVFQFFITCKRTNNANNAIHYVKLDKKRRESSKCNYNIISPRVIIKAIIIKVKTYTQVQGYIRRYTHTKKVGKRKETRKKKGSRGWKEGKKREKRQNKKKTKEKGETRKEKKGTRNRGGDGFRSVEERGY